MTLPGSGQLAPNVEIGDQLWDFHVTAVKIADDGNRYRVTATGRTSGVSITREGYNPKQELLRILTGYGSNVDQKETDP